MKIAIISRSDFRSPRVLAESLKIQLERSGVEAEIIYGIPFLGRLVSWKESKLSLHFWLKRKWLHFISDQRLMKKLRKFDIIVISECIPNAFMRSLINIEKFKKLVKIPVGLYEVYYLGNAPTQIGFLSDSENALHDRYDFHFSVSKVAEIKQIPNDAWFPIGIEAKSWELQPYNKKEIIAILDFLQPGNEAIREAQKQALECAGIKYISLNRQYTFQEIRKIYQDSAIYFMQSSEAFGLPILECLCCGVQIFTPESWWPMSWRLNDKPETHGEGLLPDCFTLYHNQAELVQQLIDFKNNYDLTESPKECFESFYSHYSAFYEGDHDQLQRFINRFSSN